MCTSDKMMKLFCPTEEDTAACRAVYGTLYEEYAADKEARIAAAAALCSGDDGNVTKELFLKLMRSQTDGQKVQGALGFSDELVMKRLAAAAPAAAEGGEAAPAATEE